MIETLRVTDRSMPESELKCWDSGTVFGAAGADGQAKAGVRDQAKA